MGERGEDGMNILEGHSTALPKTKYEEHLNGLVRVYPQDLGNKTSTKEGKSALDCKPLEYHLMKQDLFGK